MKLIKAFNFAPFFKSSLDIKIAKESLLKMKTKTNANSVILTPPGLQSTAQSTIIDFTGEEFISDSTLIELIEYAKELELIVILKPTVNCSNGTWRAFINFFDVDVPCEPKWSDWFDSHIQFHKHYAKIAEKTNCYMYICGCEMVMADRKVEHFRNLIKEVKKDFSGLVSYNCDKYQEDHVQFWDSVDVISSSGYYPLGEMKQNFDRIKKVVQKYNKDFFFAEAGCMSSAGSEKVPNNWEYAGELNHKTQAIWLNEFLEECRNTDFISGVGIWDWHYQLFTKEEAEKDKGYSVSEKEAESIVKHHFEKWKN